MDAAHDYLWQVLDDDSEVVYLQVPIYLITMKFMKFSSWKSELMAQELF